MMALGAAKSNDRVLTLEHFQVARKLLDSLENDMTLALDKVGRHEASVLLELFWTTRYGAFRFLCRRYSVPFTLR